MGQMTDSARKLEVGLKHVAKITVTDDMTPAHLRSEPLRVLSTPDMIRLIEQTAIQAVQPGLTPGQATVGTRVADRATMTSAAEASAATSVNWPSPR